MKIANYINMMCEGFSFEFELSLIDKRIKDREIDVNHLYHYRTALKNMEAGSVDKESRINRLIKRIELLIRDKAHKGAY